MPNDFFIRITHPYEHINRMVSAWALQCDKILVYEHEGQKTEKIHCHLLVVGSRVGKKQLRNIGQEYANLKGNENCSFKEYDLDARPITYMSKGTLDPKYNKGYTPEEISQAKSEWKEEKSEVKKSKLQKLYNECFPLGAAWQPILCDDCSNGKFQTIHKFGECRFRLNKEESYELCI